MTERETNSDVRYPTREEIDVVGLSQEYEVFGRSSLPEYSKVRPFLIGETFVRLYSANSSTGWFSTSSLTYQVLSGSEKGRLVVESNIWDFDQIRGLLSRAKEKQVRIAVTEEIE